MKSIWPAACVITICFCFAKNAVLWNVITWCVMSCFSQSFKGLRKLLSQIFKLRLRLREDVSFKWNGIIATRSANEVMREQRSLSCKETYPLLLPCNLKQVWPRCPYESPWLIILRAPTDNTEIQTDGLHAVWEAVRLISQERVSLA